MPFPLMPALLACLLWCASFACAQGRVAVAAPAGADVWGKPSGATSLVLALHAQEPLKCSAKQRCVDPVWPLATVDAARSPAMRPVAEVCFSTRPASPELKHAAWVGVIELRV